MAAATLLAALALVFVKVAHRIVLQGRGVRSASYIAALGEMISRQLLPRRIPRRWARDRLFHEALIDYRHLVAGEGAAFIETLIEAVGMLPVLERRTMWRWLRPVRFRAIGSYVELAGIREIPHLRTLLADQNGFVRSHAAHGLGRLGDLPSIPVILDLCRRVPPWEAARLADALALYGPEAVQPICEWILANWQENGGGEQAVIQATRVLGLIGDPGAEWTLIELLESRPQEWRIAAASALGRIASDNSRAALMRALGDEAWEVRARAVRAIANLADESLAPQIAVLLRDTQWWVRQNAAETLGELPGGIAELTKALDSDDRFAADAARNQLAERRLLPAGVSSRLSTVEG